jgi:hypothetical protein
MSESGSLSQKILGFFIKEAPTGNPAAGAANSPAGGPGRPVGAPVPPTHPGPGTIDAKFAEHFAQVLAKHNPPGPDYFEFREALRGLASLGLAEDKQYQAAWASFKAMGGSTDRTVLITTANQHLQALAADRDAFAKSVDAAIAERVGGLQREQQQLQADNETLTRQLAEIQARIQANTARLATITGEMQDQSGRLQQSRLNYEATYAHFTQQIQTDVARIGQYLGG